MTPGLHACTRAHASLPRYTHGAPPREFGCRASAPRLHRRERRFWHFRLSAHFPTVCGRSWLSAAQKGGGEAVGGDPATSLACSPGSLGSFPRSFFVSLRRETGEQFAAKTGCLKVSQVPSQDPGKESRGRREYHLRSREKQVYPWGKQKRKASRKSKGKEGEDGEDSVSFQIVDSPPGLRIGGLSRVMGVLRKWDTRWHLFCFC